MNYYEHLVDYYTKKNEPKLDILDKKVLVRPNLSSGNNRYFTEAACFHNTGDDGVPARNYESWMRNPNYKAYASYHCLNAQDAKVWQLFDWGLECFGSGSGTFDAKLNRWIPHYTEVGQNRFKSKAYSYTVDMEFTTQFHEGRQYYISPEQLISGAQWGAEMCIIFKLKKPTMGGFIRHSDIAEDRPQCPDYLQDPYRWKRFCQLGDYFYRKKLKYIEN